MCRGDGISLRPAGGLWEENSGIDPVQQVRVSRGSWAFTRGHGRTPATIITWKELKSDQSPGELLGSGSDGSIDLGSPRVRACFESLEAGVELPALRTPSGTGGIPWGK